MKTNFKRKTLLALGVGVALIVGCWTVYRYFTASFDGADEAWVYIPRGSSAEAVVDSLRSSLGDPFASRVAKAWKGNPVNAEGAYRISCGDAAWKVARRLDRGQQTPVRFTFNNLRTVDELMARIRTRLDVDSAALQDALTAEMARRRVKKAQLPAYFFPDTYQFYWNAAPEKVIATLTAEFDKFWTDDRLSQAAALGLTPTQVATLASIVEEETAVRDERPAVARLYLNRLSRGMKLQADPTVKFAVGDFSLRRILGKHLAAPSPYNTYLHPGLPPGPIRLPERASLSAVLQAPVHSYIYMCAKEDFSGRHNFATDYSTHQANAQRYRQALDRRGIR